MLQIRMKYIDYTKSERHLIDIISSVNSVEYQEKKYFIRNVGKPTVSKGEPKTDIYFLLEDNANTKKEFKISLKMKNADFLENKIKLERAKEIFGSNAQEIIYNCCFSIRDKFLKSKIIDFSNNNRAKSPIITLGWKFELMNKVSGEKSDKIALTDKQKIEVFSGSTSNKNKFALVNGKLVKNSGICNYYLQYDENKLTNFHAIMENLIPIDKFAITQDMYFACKALNYRLIPDKWDGNRPLAVWINWEQIQNRLEHKLIFNNPLETKGDFVGSKVKSILSSLNISVNNFEQLKYYLN